MSDQSTWLLNERSAPIAYRTPTGEIVYVANASYLLIWHKRRERALATVEKRERRELRRAFGNTKGRDDATIEP